MIELRHPFSIVLVGQQGVGKTTTVKNIINSFPRNNIFVYDPNNEYTTYNQLLTSSEFFRKLNTTKNGLFVVEEATSLLLQNSNNKSIIDALVRIRHRKNSILFVFHSIRSIPVYVFDFIDFGFFFRTNDRPDLIAKKYNSVFSKKELQNISSMKKYNFLQKRFR